MKNGKCGFCQAGTLVIDLKFRLGEACSHIGALLFLIAEQVASGKNLPDDLSATDQLWGFVKQEVDTSQT
jgi:hypothetical protein